MPKTPACPRCADARYTAVASHVEQGLPIRQAAAAAGLHTVSIHRHRRACASYARRVARAQKRGRGAQSLQGRANAQASAAAVERATPIIAAAVAAGASRAEAARRAGVNPATERTWYRDRPDYRAAVEAAQQEPVAS